MNNPITSNIDSFIKAASLTGNGFIDSLIIASLVPMMIAYVNGVLTFIKLISSHIFKIISTYIIEKIKIRFVGKILCIISISENNKVFSNIRDIIFNENIVSDVNSNLFKKICNITDDDALQKHYEKLTYYDKFNLSLDYSGDRMFILNKNFSVTNIDTKVFKYKNYYIKFTLQNDAIGKSDKTTNQEKEGNKITIELVTIKNDQLQTEIEYAYEVENFLLEKFNIRELITYVYTISIYDKTLIQHVTNFNSKGYIASNTGALKYGDNKFYKLKDNKNSKSMPNNLIIDLKYKNIASNEDDLKKNIILINNDMDINDNCNGFFGLYKKYIGINQINFSMYAYFINDNKIHLIHQDQKDPFRIIINIISAGKLLLEDDIVSSLSFIISTGMAANKAKINQIEDKINVNVYKYAGNSWRGYLLDRRTFDTIFIKDNTMKEIKKEVENFIRVEKLYKDCDIPYRKGMLLYGPPGTGKTSLVKAIAYEYQMNVYMVNINDSNINDDSIIDMLNSIGGSGNRILLFEDIDSAFSDKEKVKFEEKIENINVNTNDNKDSNDDNKSRQQQVVMAPRKYLTYAGLLNALDGVLSNQHGVITIMTTNYIDKLGDALIRPGRIDHKYILGSCDYNQIYNMTKYVINKSISLAKDNKLENLYQNINELDIDKLEDKIKDFATNLDGKDIKPCKIQQYILKNIENIDDIFNKWQELVE